LDGLVVERGDRAEGQDFGPLRCRRGLGLLDGLEEAFEGAQVGGFDNFGPAVDALAVT